MTDLAAYVTEAQHQAAIIELASVCGWHWYVVPDSRMCPAGWPDLVLVRPPHILFIECKTERGRVRPAQREWLDLLSRCDRVAVRVWRPGDWDEIEATLAGGTGGQITEWTGGES